MYRFTHIPLEIKQSEYSEQEKLFVSFLRENKNIVSIYSIGELGLLGVSDLDYLVVYKDIIDRDAINDFKKDYALVDTVLFLDITKIDNRNYLSHHFNYKLVYGDDLDLSFDEKNKNLNIIYAWRICFFSLLRNFYYYKSNNHIYVKNLLSQINDIRYPIYFLKNLGVEREEYIDFIDRYSTYRSSYFSHNDNQKLEGFLHEAIDLSWKIISDLEKELATEGKKSYFYGRFPSIFKKTTSENSYRRETEKKLRYIGRFSRFLYLPLGFNYRKWPDNLQKDLEKIVGNNKDFLNFGLPTLSGRVLLAGKKVVDFISLRIF